VFGIAAACSVALATIAGGTAATYLDRGPVPIYTRVATGACLGFTLLALATLILATAGGLTIVTALLATVAVLSPIGILLPRARRDQVRADARSAAAHLRATVRGDAPDTLRRFTLLALVALLLAVTFRQGAVETGDAIQTHSLANRLDLTLHLGIISSFLWGENFPPIHPEFAGAPLTYPFLVNLGAAVLVRSGASIVDALFLQSLILVTAFIALVYHWAYRLTSNRAVALLSPPLVLFGSGLGWLVMLRDAYAAGDPGFLMALPRSYTLNTANLQWGNLFTILLLPQRSLQLGLPLMVIVTTLWWRAVRAAARDVEAAPPGHSSPQRLMVLAGVTTGLLPLAHTHSLGVALVAAAGLAVFFPLWRLWATFFGVATIVSVPQLLWIVRDSPIRADSFLAWVPGWSKGPEPLLWFWFKNTGLFIPLLVLALAAPRDWISRAHLRFYLPFLLFFIIPNLFRVAPRIWDNNKVLLYWYVASVPLVALMLHRIWRAGRVWRTCATLLCLSLILAGLLDVWRVASRTVTITVFDAEAITFAGLVRSETSPGALIVRAPTANHPILLTGRPSLLGYAARVQLHGIETRAREADVACIYSGCARALELLVQHHVDYIVVSPHERGAFPVSDAFLGAFPLVTASGTYQLRRAGQPPVR
jgi:hypothetical protein